MHYDSDFPSFFFRKRKKTFDRIHHFFRFLMLLFLGRQFSTFFKIARLGFVSIRINAEINVASIDFKFLRCKWMREPRKGAGTESSLYIGKKPSVSFFFS